MRGSKRQVRPNVWELRVYAGTDPVTGKRRQVSRRHTGSARSADRALAQLVVEITDARTPATDATLSRVLDAWLEHASRDLSPTTLSTYRSYIANRVAPTLGHVAARDLTAEHLDRFYRALTDEGLAPATVRQVHAIVRRGLRQAVRWGWLASNPAEHASPPSVRRQAISPPDAATALAVIDAITAQDPDMGCLLRVLAITGARRGEVCALRWADVTDQAVTIRASVAEREELVVKGTKTHQARLVALDPATADLLAEHRQRAEGRARVGMARLTPQGFVFSRSLDGTIPLRPSAVTGAWRRECKRQGASMRLHDLRHLMASLLLDASVPAVIVAGRLGHSQTSTTTDIYGHRLTGADRQAADLIARLLEGTHRERPHDLAAD